MKKLILPIIILIIGGLVISQIPKFQNRSQEYSTQTRQKLTVYQNVNIQGHSTFNTFQIEKGKTALDLLNLTSKIATRGIGKNAFVTEINGRKANDSKKEFWAFYANGKQAEVGAGSYTLHPSDKIQWKIETY